MKSKTTKTKKTDKITNLTIDRSKWGCGKNGGYLLSHLTGLQCCLGFATLQAGFKSCEIKDHCQPSELIDDSPESRDRFEKINFLIDSGTDGDSDICNDLMEINDDQEISNHVREKRLTQKFAKAGVKVKFVGEFKE